MEFEYQPDPLDIASALETAERDACVRAARNKPSMVACGACHNCNEALPHGVLFCDRDCRDDYEHREKRQKT